MNKHTQGIDMPTEDSGGTQGNLEASGVPKVGEGGTRRILGDLRIFQAIHNDLKLSHQIVTDQTGRQTWAYVYDGTDPYELEDKHFPTILAAVATQVAAAERKKAELIWQEEQKCQQAINDNPTDAHLNGRLLGLQRARDIIEAQADQPSQDKEEQ